MGTLTHMAMIRTILLSATFAAACTSTAQLAADLPATTGQHLLEVNDHWTRMDPSTLDGTRVVRFNSDVERIAEHLHRVRQHLSQYTPEGLNAIARKHRITLLDALDTYADRGIFPMNNIVAGRSPVFIDHVGNACAVGHLMITSGHTELAERISKEMNLAYVQDIALPGVAEWAHAHGLTIEELAWIQPTYDRMMWRGPQVLASVRRATGTLIFVQSPDPADAKQKLRLIERGDRGDKVLATLPMLAAVQAVEFDGRVFVGGLPRAERSDGELFEWNGSSLIKHDPFPGVIGVQNMHVANGSLYVVSYQPGNNKSEQRRLTPSGVWETPPPSVIEPLQAPIEQPHD